MNDEMNDEEMSRQRAALEQARPRLCAPFPAEEMDFLVVGTDADAQGEYGTVAAFVERRSYERRVIGTLGAGAYSASLRSFDDGTVCCRAEIAGVIRESLGDRGTEIRSREAQAIKRAFRGFGVGRFALRMRQPKVRMGKLERRGKSVLVPRQTREELRQGYEKSLATRLEGRYGPALSSRGFQGAPAQWSGPAAAKALAAGSYTDAFAALCRPLEPAAVSFLPGNKTASVYFPHISVLTVQERLDAVVGLTGWSVELADVGAQAIRCRLTVLGVARDSYGTGESRLAQEANAVKRAAACHGIAQHLYDDEPYFPPKGEVDAEAIDQALRQEYERRRLPRAVSAYGEVLGHDDEVGQVGDEGEVAGAVSDSGPAEAEERPAGEPPASAGVVEAAGQPQAEDFSVGGEVGERYAERQNGAAPAEASNGCPAPQAEGELSQVALEVAGRVRAIMGELPDAPAQEMAGVDDFLALGQAAQAAGVGRRALGVLSGLAVDGKPERPDPDSITKQVLYRLLVVLEQAKARGVTAEELVMLCRSASEGEAEPGARFRAIERFMAEAEASGTAAAEVEAA